MERTRILAKNYVHGNLSKPCVYDTSMPAPGIFPVQHSIVPNTSQRFKSKCEYSQHDRYERKKKIINELELFRPPLPRYPERTLSSSQLIEFAPSFIIETFNCDINFDEPSKRIISLKEFLITIMNRTGISSNTLITAFFYLHRLKLMHPRCKGSDGSGHRLFLSAMILAAKYMYDDTFDNTSWATVSSGLFKLDQVNNMEREMLGFLDFNLFILSEEWLGFYDMLRVKLEDFKLMIDYRIPSHGYATRANTARNKVTTYWNEGDSKYQSYYYQS